MVLKQLTKHCKWSWVREMRECGCSSLPAFEGARRGDGKPELRLRTLLSSAPRTGSGWRLSAGTTTSCSTLLHNGVIAGGKTTPCGVGIGKSFFQAGGGVGISSMGRESCVGTMLRGRGVWRGVRIDGLTLILPSITMQHIAHADTSRNIFEKQRDQAGAPRAGVGLQPPTSAADTDGADGADASLHCGDRSGLPPTFGGGGSSDRPVRSGRGGVAPACNRRLSPP